MANNFRSQFDELISSRSYVEALSLAEQWVSTQPEDLEAALCKAKILCYFQREDEALTILEAYPCGPEAKEIGELLARYASARAGIAAKLGVADSPGKDLVHRLLAAGFELSEAAPKLSAVLIVKNESQHLARCLESLVKHVDEIVVIDTGSTDDTVEIAHNYGAKLGHFEWCDDFSAARNASLSLATGDWALWIDADEVVDESSWKSIYEGLIRPHFGGYFIRIVNFTDEDENSRYTHCPVRLFQLKPEIRFSGRIHEQITPAIEAIGLPVAQLENALIWHYGYKPSEMAQKGKLERTFDLLHRQIEEEPEDAFHWFNLANAYSVAQQPQNVLEPARKCADLLVPGHAFGSLTFQLLSSALNALGRPEEGLDVGLEAKQRGFFTILNQFELAHSLLLLRRFGDALTAIDACIAMPWPSDMTGDEAIVSHKSDVLRGQILTELGRVEEALGHFEKALAVDPNFALTWLGIGRALERNGNLEDAVEAFSKGFDDPTFGPQCLKAASRVVAEQGQWEQARDWARRALDMRPFDRQAWSLWAISLEHCGSPEQCVAAYTEFCDNHEQHCDVLVNWGRALVESGNDTAAGEKFQAAVELDETNANAYLNLGDWQYRQGQYAVAAESYQAALRLEPLNAQAWFCLGNAAVQLGVASAAAAAYRQTLALDPHHDAAKSNLELVEAA